MCFYIRGLNLVLDIMNVAGLLGFSWLSIVYFFCFVLFFVHLKACKYSNLRELMCPGLTTLSTLQTREIC